MNDVKDYEVIEGFKCYAPALARSNTDFHAEFFEKLFELEDKHFWFRSRNQMIRNLCKKYLSNTEKSSFLEIGCGTGYVLKGLSANPLYNLMGAEIFVEGLKFASRRLPDVEFVQLDATNITFANEFDAIGAFDVLEHIEEDEQVMENVYKALKPRGFFFITVPQYEWMWSLEDDLACHKRRYTKKELVSKLTKAGFEIKMVNSFVFMLFPFMALQRVLNVRKEIKENADITETLKLPGLVNSVFYRAMRMDVWAIRNNIPLPWGGSLVCVARRKG